MTIKSFLACLLLLITPAAAQEIPSYLGQALPVPYPKQLQPNLASPNLWLGANSAPACALTNGAVISVNLSSCVTAPGIDGIDLGTITLTQNSQFAFPTGLPSGGNLKFGFRINHGSGPYSATFAHGYTFPNAALGGGQPMLSSSGTDYVWCVSEEGSPPGTVDCPGLGLAMTSVSSFTIVDHNIGSGCANGTTCAGTQVTYTSTTNQLGLVAVQYCDVGASTCAGGTTQGVTVSGVSQTAGSATSTCVAATGIAGVTDSVDHTTQNIFICTPTVSGTATYTATFSGTAHGGTVSTVIAGGVVIASPDDGIGKTAAGTANPSVTTTGTTSQPSEFLFSASFAVGGSAPTAGTGYTQIDSSGSTLTQYATSGVSGATQTAAAVTTATGSVISVLAIK